MAHHLSFTQSMLLILGDILTIADPENSTTGFAEGSVARVSSVFVF
jgi:hypothetical protein